MAFYFKACPKCKGDLADESDSAGSYKKCIQCGRLFEDIIPLVTPGDQQRLHQPHVNRKWGK